MDRHLPLRLAHICRERESGLLNVCLLPHSPLQIRRDRRPLLVSDQPAGIDGWAIRPVRELRNCLGLRILQDLSPRNLVFQDCDHLVCQPSKGRIELSPGVLRLTFVLKVAQGVSLFR